MATKTIDVTLAAIRNAGTGVVSPKGAIQARVVRAVDDEQVFQSELLYFRQSGPIHPSGATNIRPNESLTYNVTARLTLAHFEEESANQLNQMLIFGRDLTEDLVVGGTVDADRPYQGSFNRKLRFDEIDEFNTVSCDYNIFSGDVTVKIIATYTVNLVSSSE